MQLKINAQTLISPLFSMFECMLQHETTFTFLIFNTADQNMFISTWRE